MSTFLPYLISWVQSYGYPVLWLCVFFSSAGLPLPTILVLLAAGAFAALGDFNIILLSVITVSASTVGDSIGYLIGRQLGTRLLVYVERQQKFRFISPKALAQAHTYFQRRGGTAVFLTRFLFAPLGGVTNLVAGTERYPYRRFLFFDFTGEVLGALIPLLLGFAFGASWEAIGEIMSAVSLFAVAFLCVIWLLMYLIKILRRQRQAKAGGVRNTAALMAEQPLLAQEVPAETKPNISDSLPL